MELLRRPTSAGSDLDVCGARHDRQALNPFSDPLCSFRLIAGFCHRDGALYFTERGRGRFKVHFFFKKNKIKNCPIIKAVKEV